MSAGELETLGRLALCEGILKTSEGFSEKTVKQKEVKQHTSA